MARPIPAAQCVVRHSRQISATVRIDVEIDIETNGTNGGCGVRRRRLLCLFLALGLFAAACGRSDSDKASDEPAGQHTDHLGGRRQVRRRHAGGHRHRRHRRHDHHPGDGRHRLAAGAGPVPGQHRRGARPTPSTSTPTAASVAASWRSRSGTPSSTRARPRTARSTPARPRWPRSAATALFNPDVAELSTCADAKGAAHRHPEHRGHRQRRERAVRHEHVPDPGHARDLPGRRLGPPPDPPGRDVSFVTHGDHGFGYVRAAVETEQGGTREATSIAVPARSRWASSPRRAGGVIRTRPQEPTGGGTATTAAANAKL